jgi:hypothetical protein
MVLLRVETKDRMLEATSVVDVVAAVNSKDSAVAPHKVRSRVKLNQARTNKHVRMATKVSATLGPNRRVLLKHPKLGCRGVWRRVVWTVVVVLDGHYHPSVTILLS